MGTNSVETVGLTASSEIESVKKTLARGMNLGTKSESISISPFAILTIQIDNGASFELLYAACYGPRGDPKLTRSPKSART
jgi:hypothetical protein